MKEDTIQTHLFYITQSQDTDLRRYSQLNDDEDDLFIDGNDELLYNVNHQSSGSDRRTSE